MNKNERVKIIIKRLEEIYPETPIPLDHENEFTLLVAVVLSAQSTDKKVNELSKELFKVATSAEGATLRSSLVNSLTFLSVDCALNTTATSSVKPF